MCELTWYSTNQAESNASVPGSPSLQVCQILLTSLETSFASHFFLTLHMAHVRFLRLLRTAADL